MRSSLERRLERRLQSAHSALLDAQASGDVSLVEELLAQRDAALEARHAARLGAA